MRKISKTQSLILLIFSLSLLIISCKKKENKFDIRFSLNKTSHKPYDTKFFYDKILENSYLTSETSTSPKYGYLDSIEDEDSVSYIYMVVSPQFFPSSNEINRIKNFASRGNTVFVSSYNFSTEWIDSLFYRAGQSSMMTGFPPKLDKKKWHIQWKNYDSTYTKFQFPSHYPQFSKFDSLYVLGNNAVTAIDTIIKDNFGNIQMLKMNCGDGLIYLSNNPILLSNYSLLNKQNYKFFNTIADELNIYEYHVYWDDFYKKRYVQPAPEDSNNDRIIDESEDAGDTKFWEIIHENKPLMWAFYTFLGGIALFVLNFFRRIQKPVPIQQSLQNNSEAYINVISGLYWQQQSHKTIAEKIINQFFEFLSNHFHINSKEFSEEEFKKISQKTGRNIGLLRDINNSIQFIRTNDEIEQQNLINLYQKVNEFYSPS